MLEGNSLFLEGRPVEPDGALDAQYFGQEVNHRLGWRVSDLVREVDDAPAYVGKHQRILRSNQKDTVRRRHPERDFADAVELDGAALRDSFDFILRHTA